ncbi:competence protein CoiA family protein [uncultured Pseudokineococcus sp.]|uniref:competence protein CoiA family protein n=1 Tax=uncultured Pseudokineococcus sp. TaxID=1642928 RepID=UPI0026269D05|nr:competence protein CoiA family protein [uncultured Pseudokineococcus sp.]
MGGHAAEVVRRFTGGETRLVYARRVTDPTGPLLFLAHGAAEAARELAKRGELECPMPECDDRRLRAVSRTRSGRRDGFTHHRGAGAHGSDAEGLEHLQGKALVAAWARRAAPEASVVVEGRVPSAGRVADVLVTWPDRAAVAVEVQCASLTVVEWERRHRAYAAAGVRDVWLLGRRYLRAAPGATATAAVAAAAATRRGDPTGPGELVEVPALVRAMAAAEVPVMWVSPTTGEVAVPWVRAWSHTCLTRRCTCPPRTRERWSTFSAGAGARPWRDVGFAEPPTGETTASQVWAKLLERCRLDPAAGIAHPVEDRLRASQRELVEAREWDAMVQRPAVLAQQEADQVAAHRAGARARREDAQRRRWASSPLRARLERDFAVPPAAVVVELEHAGGVHAPQPHWHAVLLYDVLRAGRPGDPIPLAACRRALAAHGIAVDDPAMARSVHEWFEQCLLSKVYVQRARPVGAGRWCIGRHRLLTDAEKTARAEVRSQELAGDYERLRRSVEGRQYRGRQR